jgi:hypothetical protein
VVAVVTLGSSIVSGSYLAVADALFFYLGGNGVRQRSKIAAICVFVVYALGGIVVARISYAAGGSANIVRILLSALLLANVRAVWIASKWRSVGGVDESPPRLNETLADKIADVAPFIVWPKTRYLFYAFAFLEIGALAFVLLRPIR